MEYRKLKSLRVLHGINQGDMSKKIDIHQRSYHSKENGRSEFTVKELRKVAKALNLSLEEVNEVFQIVDAKN